ncbi:hypothetical protein ALP26_102737 [Pseudomonas savastanoi pv. glycinea]|uniref:Uncharacterized protein n=1 Tax=Pseudomonas savastanoi pv. glycinea TaxID=318 RepID=A0A0P9QUS9_PSESG|nr:Unknown protein sequence [Pseudomonas savastanoi pv. glycinea]KPC37319.1 Unknown protein sequence [Pseudomonas savastanoi pv. glycinea]KPC44267.1 Unknown protein sequence [Pseudomonas savastanoi pv. glycinea]KPX35842.1 hypothetical protein ALO37_102095 [Pseudomonas savastanoi pv. glycinea]RML39827.1 hypothetical protein ALQ97_102333 [Pseudomonas savastanoi pv. glycinea]
MMVVAGYRCAAVRLSVLSETPLAQLFVCQRGQYFLLM